MLQSSEVRFPPRENIFFSRMHRLLYVATPKVACTSMKWWFADLLGVRDKVISARYTDESTDELKIHDILRKVLPDECMPDEVQLQIIQRDTDIFKFCIVRNPYTRIFSAWQSKWLLRERIQSAPYVNADFMRFEVKNKKDVIQSIEMLLEYVHENEYPCILDSHLMGQDDLLATKSMQYDVVAKIESPNDLVALIKIHQGGGDANPFAIRRSNESLIPYSSEFFSDRSVALVRLMYERDFEKFEYAIRPPESQGAIDEKYIELALRAAQQIALRNKRIGDLYSQNADILSRTEAYQVAEEILGIRSSATVKSSESDCNAHADMVAHAKIRAQKRIMQRIFYNDIFEV